MIKDTDIRLSAREAADPQAVRTHAAKALGIKSGSVRDLRIIRRSIDARRPLVKVQLSLRVAWGDDATVPINYAPVCFPDVSHAERNVVIVGAGPAGLFAALKAIELGVRPIVLERGKDVDARRLDIAAICRGGTVDADSNFCFGEGGAGTFSDGKLFTRSKKRGNVDEILCLLHQHGAREEILTDAHPHIGSDRLPLIIKNIRETIVSCGGEVHFGTRMTHILLSVDGCEAIGVETADGRQYMGPVVLATGHSARDVYRSLVADGIEVEAKGLAIGVRLEHPQHLIDSIQYHSPDGRGKWLPPAEYSFVAQAGGRGVYSFCMCPGGVIVPAASGPGQLVVNGMSASARSSRWANSGMVVELHPGDFPEFDSHGPLSMLALQESLERDFYEAAGQSLTAPAQLMTDFINGRTSSALPDSSYRPAVAPGRLDKLLPPFIAGRLREGFQTFGRRAPGFVSQQALMVGLESRTSSPVRIPRDRETMCHIRIRGLYPAGEGAGYAGGIVSAAIDGQNAVKAAFAHLSTIIE